MKNTIWANVKTSIFFTTMDMGWQKEWDILLYNEEPVTSMEVAIRIVKVHFKGITIGLATYEQMVIGNAEWDNL